MNKTRKSEKNEKKVLDEFRDYNKWMKSLGLSLKTFEEYITYRKGKSKYIPKVVKDPLKPKKYYRTAPKYPSGIGIGVLSSKKEMRYTGNEIIGISTMHKSNLVPIRKKSDAEDIAKMRR